MSSGPTHLKVVSKDKASRDNLLAKLKEIQTEADNGVLATMLYVRIDTHGNWTPGWCGATLDRLKAIGCLEALKMTMYTTAEDA